MEMELWIVIGFWLFFLNWVLKCFMGIGNYCIVKVEICFILIKK